METVRTRAAEYRPTDRQLRLLAGGLAIVVAVLHLFHPDDGLPRILELLFAFGPGAVVTFLGFDPRPAAFVLSGIVLVLGVLLGAVGYPRKSLYLGGMALVAAYFLGYFAWHFTGHGGFLPGREPLYHGMTPVQAVVVHLTTEPLAAASKLAEAALFATLAVLYRREET